MCLGPEVDIAVGIGIAALAVETIRKNPESRTLPISLIPAIFSIHLFASAIVWFGFEKQVPSLIQTVATYLYIAIAFILWPTYVPIAIYCIEPPGWRKQLLAILATLGGLTSVQFLVATWHGNSSATQGDYFIDFHVTGTPAYSGALYFVTTCGAVLLSNYRPLLIWGIANAAVVAFLTATANHGLPSLWCFWAATTSGFVLWFIRTWQPNVTQSIDEGNL